MPVNTYEMLGREKKAAALAQAIAEAGITSAEALGAPEGFWVIAAEGAGVKLPSAETRRMVVSMMRGQEEKVRSVR